MSFVLGTPPVPMTVVLPSDADFVSSMTSTTGSWPGTGVTLEILDRTGATIASWDADISGAVASWDVPAATVAPVIAARPATARLHYYDTDGSDLLWAKSNSVVIS